MVHDRDAFLYTFFVRTPSEITQVSGPCYPKATSAASYSFGYLGQFPRKHLIFRGHSYSEQVLVMYSFVVEHCLSDASL
jgi:hypothetical protein